MIRNRAQWDDRESALDASTFCTHGYREIALTSFAAASLYVGAKGR